MKKYAYVDTTTRRIGVAELRDDGQFYDTDGPAPRLVPKPDELIEFDFEVDLPIANFVNDLVNPEVHREDYAWGMFKARRAEPIAAKLKERAEAQTKFENASQRFQDILAAPERLTRELKLARQAVREARETLKGQKATKSAFDKEQKSKKGDEVVAEATRQRRALVISLAIASSNDELDKVLDVVGLIPSAIEAERAIAKTTAPAPVEAPVVDENLVSDSQKKVAELEIQLLDARSAAKLAQLAQKTFSNQTDAFRMQKIDSGWRPRL